VDETFRSLTGQHLNGLWRAPGGRATQNAIRWAANRGYPVHVHWNEAGFIGDEPASEKSPNDKLLRQALGRIRPGAVTMMHRGFHPPAGAGHQTRDAGAAFLIPPPTSDE
jgi:peptidoglycan/xylan/chitin deacetylase (PgdA/CDA1 family)